MKKGVIISDLTTKETFGISLDEMQAQDVLEMQSFLERVHQNRKKYKIHCQCSPAAQMTLKKKKRYFFSTHPNKLQNHLETCAIAENLKETILSGRYLPALELIDDTHWILHGQKIGILENKPAQTATEAQWVEPKNSSQRGKMTIGSLGRELLAAAWNDTMDRHVKEKKPYPSILGIRFALDRLFSQPNAKIEVKLNHLKLQPLLYLGKAKIGAVYRIHKEQQAKPIVLMPFKKEQIETYDQTRNQLTLTYLQNGKLSEKEEHDVFRQFLVDKEEWKQATSTDKVYVNYEKHEQFFIIGVAQPGAFGQPPAISNITLIPVTKRGMFVDSSYERLFFELLENQKRDFIKPNRPMQMFGGLKPDAIIRDTVKPTIVEIYGMSESNINYHRFSKAKSEYYKTLDGYNFYEWKAYLYENPKYIPSKKR